MNPRHSYFIVEVIVENNSHLIQFMTITYFACSFNSIIFAFTCFFQLNRYPIQKTDIKYTKASPITYYLQLANAEKFKGNIGEGI